jgi:hypothetical protein
MSDDRLECLSKSSHRERVESCDRIVDHGDALDACINCTCCDMQDDQWLTLTIAIQFDRPTFRNLVCIAPSQLSLIFASINEITSLRPRYEVARRIQVMHGQLPEGLCKESSMCQPHPQHSAVEAHLATRSDAIG